MKNILIFYTVLIGKHFIFVHLICKSQPKKQTLNHSNSKIIYQFNFVYLIFNLGLLKLIETNNVIFECNFDDGDCNGKLFPEDFKSNDYEIGIVDRFTKSDGYTITDKTSICIYSIFILLFAFERKRNETIK